MTATKTKMGTPAPQKPESKQNARIAVPKGAPIAVATPSALDKQKLRDEARARWVIRKLEESLKLVRMSREDITSQAQAIGGPGESIILHDERGAPIGLAKVRNGRESLDVEQLVSALAKATGQSEDMVTATFRKTGQPYIEFVEG